MGPALALSPLLLLLLLPSPSLSEEREWTAPGLRRTLGLSPPPQVRQGCWEAGCTAWSARLQPLPRGRTRSPDLGTIHAPSNWRTSQVRGQIVDVPLVSTRVE